MKTQGQAPDLRNNHKELSDSQRAYYGVFLISFFLMLILHLYITKRGDDLYFVESVKHCDSLFHWFQMRYFQHSSRLLFEAALVFLLKLPDIVWKVADSLVFAGIACLVSMQAGEQKRSRIWFGLLLCFIYPFGELASAGYIATTVTYLWPLFFLLLCFTQFAALRKAEKASAAKQALYYISLVLAASIEQTCVILFGVYILQCIQNRIDKEKISRYTIIGLAIIGIEMVFILTCPGNAFRRMTEASDIFPEYARLDLLRLLEMGVSSIGDRYLLKQNFLFFLFSFVLCLTGQNMAKSNVHKFIYAIPLTVSLCFSVFSGLFYQLFPALTHIAGSLTKFGIYSGLVSIAHSFAFVCCYRRCDTILHIYALSREQRTRFVPVYNAHLGIRVSNGHVFFSIDLAYGKSNVYFHGLFSAHRNALSAGFYQDQSENNAVCPGDRACRRHVFLPTGRVYQIGYAV